MHLALLFLIMAGLESTSFQLCYRSGGLVKKARMAHVLPIGLVFAIIHMLLLFAGIKLGHLFHGFYAEFDTWLPSAILVFLGVRKLVKLFLGRKDLPFMIDRMSVTVGLAIVSGIDGLLVGLVFSFYLLPIAHVVVNLGLLTFAFCFTGLLTGIAYRKLWVGRTIEMVGGLLLLLSAIWLYAA